jgi:hypothetical protein
VGRRGRIFNALRSGFSSSLAVVLRGGKIDKKVENFFKKIAKRYCIILENII